MFGLVLVVIDCVTVVAFFSVLLFLLFKFFEVLSVCVKLVSRLLQFFQSYSGCSKFFHVDANVLVVLLVKNVQLYVHVVHLSSMY